jgi:glycine cleavage system aminomethyltransferase T
LVWNADDAEHTFGSLFHKGAAAKYIDFPSAVYSMLPYDKVSKGGQMVGVSTWSGYSFNERAMLSLATIDPAYSQPGTEITLLWGEGESRRPPVEPHKQTEIRVTVAPAPYSEVARTAYRPQ